MNPDIEEVEEIAMKFRWIDSDKIKVINNEGMEKLVQIIPKIINGKQEYVFEEIAYG